jgi:hypothetical protein
MFSCLIFLLFLQSWAGRAHLCWDEIAYQRAIKRSYTAGVIGTSYYSLSGRLALSKNNKESSGSPYRAYYTKGYFDKLSLGRFIKIHICFGIVQYTFGAAFMRS